MEAAAGACRWCSVLLGCHGFREGRSVENRLKWDGCWEHARRQMTAKGRDDGDSDDARGKWGRGADRGEGGQPNSVWENLS